MLRVAVVETEYPGRQETLDIYQATEGFRTHRLDAREIHELEPRLTPDVIRGLYLYGNSVVDSHLCTVIQGVYHAS